MQNGFMVVARGDEVEFQLFDAGRIGHAPLATFAADAFHQVALMGRLYYRQELLERLTKGGCVEEAADDAALALAAYRWFGREGVERLEGDFAVVIWDRRACRLLASREAMGGYPIYWFHQGRTIALATGLRPLVDLLPNRSLNVGFLGEVLMLPNVEMDYFEEAVFEGVQRLQPGWLLTADLAAGQVQQHEFWKWPERIVDPDADRPEEIPQRFADLLRAAVRERLRGTVASHLSGGMDSTSVALLAAEELAGQGRSLHGLSMVYQNLSNLDRETPYLEAALNRPGLTPHRVPADGILDYDVFRDLPLHDEPISGIYRAGFPLVMLHTAAAAGADMVFTGLGADEALAMRPYYVADLFRRGRALAAWSEATRWARAENDSAWQVFRRYALSPLLPPWAQAGLPACFRGGYADWKHQNFWTIAPWVLPDFARRGQLRRRALEHVRQMFQASSTVVESETLAGTRYFCGDWVRYALAAPLGIVNAHPFRDLRVFSYGLGLRRRVQPEPGLQKPILAEAMRDVLPVSIRQRRSKTHYNSLYFAGVARNLPHLEAMIRGSAIEDLGLFNKDCLLRCLRQAALCIRSRDGAVCLDNTLSIVKWLAQLPQWLAQKPVPARVIRTNQGVSCESCNTTSLAGA